MNFLPSSTTSRKTFILIPILLIIGGYLHNTFFAGPTLGPIVEIANGKIRGIIGVSRDGTKFYEYLKIPFAKPPVLDLRFEPPQPPDNWVGVRDGSRYGPACIQIEFFTNRLVGEESCLFLNIFTPRNPEIKNEIENKIPVIVYIHGGYFMSGGSKPYRAEYLMDSTKRPVILVTLTYRVGALGFLNTENEIVTGNQGLKDQVMALKFIKENIGKFGGDKNNVIIYGASAGAASIHYHIISKMSKGLFHKAISASGSAIKPLSFIDTPGAQAKRLAKKVNCPTNSSLEMIKCLKSLDASKIVNTHWDYVNLFLDPLAIYAPSIENTSSREVFLSDKPLNILKRGDFPNKVPYMSGLNAEEGLLNSARAIKNREYLKKINQNWPKFAPTLLSYPNSLDSTKYSEITRKISKFYFGKKYNQIDFTRDFKNFTNMFSDRLYYVGTHDSAKIHAQSSPVFLYYLTYRNGFSFSSVLALKGRLSTIVEVSFKLFVSWISKKLFNYKINNYGVCHGDDLPLIYHLNLISIISQKDPEYELSRDVVKLWVDFAYMDDPNKLTIRDVIWRPNFKITEKEDLYYLKIDNEPEMILEPFKERILFWKSLGLEE